MKKQSSYIYYTGLGFQMVATIALFALIGYWLDSRQDSERMLYTGLLALLGVLVSLIGIIRSVLKNNKNR